MGFWKELLIAIFVVAYGVLFLHLLKKRYKKSCDKKNKKEVEALITNPEKQKVRGEKSLYILMEVLEKGAKFTWRSADYGFWRVFFITERRLYGYRSRRPFGKYHDFSTEKQGTLVIDSFESAGEEFDENFVSGVYYYVFFSGSDDTTCARFDEKLIGNIERSAVFNSSVHGRVEEIKANAKDIPELVAGFEEVIETIVGQIKDEKLPVERGEEIILDLEDQRTELIDKMMKPEGI